jgi:hypothetical protein
MPLARDAVQPADALVDELRGQLAADLRDTEIEVRRVGADRAQVIAEVAVLGGAVIVDALSLAAVLDGVLELVGVEPAERQSDAPAVLGETLDVVVPIQLQEVAMLPDVSRR